MRETNAETPDIIDRALQKAAAVQLTGRLKEAEQLYRAILQVQPEHAEACHQLGLLAMTAGQPDVALPFLKTALEAKPAVGELWLTYIDALIRYNRHDMARSVLAQGRQRGLHGDAVEDLVARLESPAAGNGKDAFITERNQGKPKKVANKGRDATGNTVRRHPSAPPSAEMAAVVTLFDQGRFESAEQRARNLTQRFPAHGFGWKALGLVLGEIGRLEEALAALQKAVRLLPRDAEAHNNLGNALIDIGRPTDAENSLRRALALKSEFALAHFNLGNALKDQRRLAKAETRYRCALALQPDYTKVYTNLGNVLKDQGSLSAAEASYRRALTITPDFADAFSNYLFALNCHTERPPGFRFSEACRYGAMVASKVTGRYTHWSCDLAPQRLRIGFVSGDLRKHPVGYFLQSVLGAIDPNKFELFAYTTSRKTDALTTAMRSYFSAWTPLSGLADSTAAARIHADGIHLLIDLSGHTAHNRLPIFAWKAAPVQVAWLGYFATTGLAEMDYILADDVGVPSENHAQFVEKVWYLPNTRLCFTPPDGAPDISTLPAMTRGYVTFACFQNLAKMSDAVLAQWKRILDGLPSARLRLQNRSFADKAVQNLFIQRLALHGIDASRVTLHGPVPRKAYLAAHSQVDILLDTFAFPGGTTTCESLWMGVPTVTLAGDTLLARQGASILAVAGLPQWVAASEDDYVAKAVAFAGDLPKLATLRATLRGQVSTSPLFDAALFAGHFQDAMAAMWRLFLVARTPS